MNTKIKLSQIVESSTLGIILAVFVQSSSCFSLLFGAHVTLMPMCITDGAVSPC